MFKRILQKRCFAALKTQDYINMELKYGVNYSPYVPIVINKGEG